MASVDITDLRMALGIGKTKGELLHLLMEHKVLSTADLVEAGVNQPRKAISWLRDRLGELTPPVEVQSHRRLGYWIEDEGKDRLVLLCSRQKDNTIEVDDNGEAEVV